MPEVLDAPTLAIDVDDRLGDLLVALEVGAEDLDRVLALDAGERLLDVVGDVLREVEDDAGERLAELAD